MNKINIKIFALALALIISGFAVRPVQAQDNNLILGITTKCDFQYAGDSCVAELKIANNAGKVLDGEANLHIDYQGACSNNKSENFDGEGITVHFSTDNVNWLDFSGWKDGTTAVSGFNIAQDQTRPELKIKTVPNLCPGEYTFSLGLNGGKYIAPPIVIGGSRGGGGGIACAAGTAYNPSTSSCTPIGQVLGVSTGPACASGDLFDANTGKVCPSGGQVLGAAVYNFTRNLGVGSRGADVTALQQYLTDAKFYTGPITGYFGQLTKTAVIAYQKANNLPQTGYVGPLTLALLNKNVVPTVAENTQPAKTGLMIGQASAIAGLFQSIVGIFQSFGADVMTIANVKHMLGL